MEIEGLYLGKRGDKGVDTISMCVIIVIRARDEYGDRRESKSNTILYVLAFVWFFFAKLMCVIREIGSFSRVYNVFCKWYFEYCTSISKSLNDS